MGWTVWTSDRVGKTITLQNIGNGYLKWKELEEVLLDVETALNNRPLQYLEDDIQMPTLTPNLMLFVGYNTMPELETHHEEEVDLHRRATLLSRCKDAVWRRWSTEYLRRRYESNIIKRTGQTNFKLSKGDMVIIKLDERNRASWSLGIVDELYSARDNVVRAVKLY